MGTPIETNYNFYEYIPMYPFNSSYSVKYVFAPNFVFEIGRYTSNGEYKLAIAVVTPYGKKSHVFDNIPFNESAPYDAVLKDDNTVRFAFCTNMGSPNDISLVVVDCPIVNGDISNPTITYYYKDLAETVLELAFNRNNIDEIFFIYGTTYRDDYKVSITRVSLSEGHQDVWDTTFNDVNVVYYWTTYTLGGTFGNNEQVSFTNANLSFYWDLSSNQAVLLKMPMKYHDDDDNNDYYVNKTLSYNSGRYVFDQTNSYLFDLKNQNSLTLPIYSTNISSDEANIIMNSDHVILLADEVILEYDENGNFIRGYSDLELNYGEINFFQKDNNGYFGHNSQHFVATQDQINKGTSTQGTRHNNISEYTFYSSTMSYNDVSSKDIETSTDEVDLTNTAKSLYTRHFNVFDAFRLSLVSKGYEIDNEDVITLERPITIGWNDTYTDIVSVDTVCIKTPRNKYCNVSYDNHQYTLAINDIVGEDDVDVSIGINYDQTNEIIYAYNFLYIRLLTPNFFPFFC